MTVLEELNELRQGPGLSLLALTMILGLAIICGATAVLHRWAEVCRPTPAIDPKARITIERRLDEIERRLDAAARELRPR